MAGMRAIIGGSVCFIDFADAEGSATVNGKVWRWEYHNFLGPTFVLANGEARKCQNPPKAVWAAFEKWEKNRNKKTSTP